MPEYLLTGSIWASQLKVNERVHHLRKVNKTAEYSK